MSKHYEKHAQEIVQGFMDMLDEDAKSCISESDLGELAMMVEAAISTAALEQLEKAADDVAALSRSLRKYAEHYDKG